MSSPAGAVHWYSGSLPLGGITNYMNQVSFSVILLNTEAQSLISQGLLEGTGISRAQHPPVCHASELCAHEAWFLLLLRSPRCFFFGFSCQHTAFSSCAHPWLVPQQTSAPQCAVQPSLVLLLFLWGFANSSWWLLPVSQEKGAPNLWFGRHVSHVKTPLSKATQAYLGQAKLSRGHQDWCTWRSIFKRLQAPYLFPALAPHGGWGNSPVQPSFPLTCREDTHSNATNSLMVYMWLGPASISLGDAEVHPPELECLPSS